MDQRNIMLLIGLAVTVIFLWVSIKRIKEKEHTILDKLEMFFGSILLLIAIGGFFFT